MPHEMRIDLTHLRNYIIAVMQTTGPKENALEVLNRLRAGIQEQLDAADREQRAAIIVRLAQQEGFRLARFKGELLRGGKKKRKVEQSTLDLEDILDD